MKVLHVTQNYHPSNGGTQYAIKKISEIFFGVYNDDVTVYTSNSMFGPNRSKFEQIPLQEEVINGVKVRRFSFLRFHFPLIVLFGKFLRKVFNKPLPEFLIALLQGPISANMRRAINANNADVIGASSIHYLFADYPFWRKHTRNPKPFVMFGAMHLHSHKILDVYLRRLQAAEYYIANSSYEKKHLVSLGCPAENIKVIGVGSDIETKADFSITDAQLKEAYNIPTGTVVITYLGRQEAFKGIPVLLEAFLKRSPAESLNTQLFICGASSSYTPELKKIANNNSNIRLFCDITELQKTEILRVTDVLVLPSKEESFGIVFLEGWSFSKPVIGAGIGAIASIIEDGKDGLLFKPDDADDLAEKLTTLISNQPLRQTLGNNGNTKFKENYTWDIVAKKFRAVYEEAIIKFNAQRNKN